MGKEITIEEAVVKIKEYKRKLDNSILKRNEEAYKILEGLIPRATNPVKEIKPFCPECGKDMNLLEGLKGIKSLSSTKKQYLMKFECRNTDCGFKKPLRILFEIGEL